MNRLLLSAGVIGFLCVGLGAFGAHGLALSEKAAGWWETATLYGLTHSVAALAIALQGGALRLGAWFFVAGAALFSGSLYAMALGAPTFLGMITPLGGISFLIGWGLIIYRGAKGL